MKMLGHQLVDVVETPVKGECNTIIVSSTLLLRNNLHSNIIFNSTNALSICRIDAYSVVVHGIFGKNKVTALTITNKHFGNSTSLLSKDAFF